MNTLENFANDSALQFALREMHRLLNLWAFWLTLCAIIIMLTISGPFNTLQEMALAPRLAYWASISVLTSLPSFTISFMINRIGQQRGWSTLAKITVAGIVASIPVSLIVWSISAFIAKNGDANWLGFLEISTRCVPIAIGITAIYTLLHRNDRLRETETPQQAEIPFLARLNPQTGRAIISLQAQDHYVEVVTTRNKEMILIRLEDAIAELGTMDGKRIHRSWWVAKTGAKSLARTQGKPVLETVDGRQLPISRSNEKTVRAWMDEV